MTSKSKKADISDVTPKAETSAAQAETKPVIDPSLRSLATENGFAVGFVLGESVKEDGSFELTTSLMYKDAGIAIAQLESVLAHARQYHNQQLYAAGVQQGERNAAGLQPQAAMDAAPTAQPSFAVKTSAPKSASKKSKKK